MAEATTMTRRRRIVSGLLQPTVVVVTFVMTSCCCCLLLLLSPNVNNVQAWMMSPPPAATLTLTALAKIRHGFASSRHFISRQHQSSLLVEHCAAAALYYNDFDENNEQEDQHHVEATTITTTTTSSYHADSGCINHLPLWHGSWTEVPGRSNVWHVRKDEDVQMFQAILNKQSSCSNVPLQEEEEEEKGSPPQYVGYVPENDIVLETTHNNNDQQKGTRRSRRVVARPQAALGTLMRIVDSRHVQSNDNDAYGNRHHLVLLVQALERFVIMETNNNNDDDDDLPYDNSNNNNNYVADVRLLPDVEEVEKLLPARYYPPTRRAAGGTKSWAAAAPAASNNDDDAARIITERSSSRSSSGWWMTHNECDVHHARATAVRKGLQKWQAYEFANDATLPPLSLPIPTNVATTAAATAATPTLVGDVSGSVLAKVLPFAPFSSHVEPADLAVQPLPGDDDARKEVGEGNDDDDDNIMLEDPAALMMATAVQQPLLTTHPEEGSNDDDGTSSTTRTTWEQRLLAAGILQHAPSLQPSFMEEDSSNVENPFFMRGGRAVTNDELERRVWLALNDFVTKTRTPISPVLLGLLPPDKHKATAPNARRRREKKVTIVSSLPKRTGLSISTAVQNTHTQSLSKMWPSSFVLQHVIQVVAKKQTDVEHGFVRVSTAYPAYRRQKRLSYAAGHIVEASLAQRCSSEEDGDAAVQAWRHLLLALPSTRERLALVWQALRFEYANFEEE